MIGYPYINDLFRAVISQSIVLQGRFYTCPLFAAEINQSTLGEIVSIAMPAAAKYPAALLMPPRKTGNFQFTGDEVGGSQIGYNTYGIQMLFLRSSTQTANYAVSQPVTNTPISTHTILESWHDMARCAEDFMQVLRQVLIYNRVNDVFISDNGAQSIIPVSNIGNDKVCGVLLHFNLLVNSGCDIEDYPSSYLTDITLPALTDTHPTHQN